MGSGRAVSTYWAIDQALLNHYVLQALIFELLRRKCLFTPALNYSTIAYK
jgi:hypothetical protein